MVSVPIFPYFPRYSVAEQASVQSLNAHRFPPLGGYCIAPCGRYISKKGLSWGKIGLLSGRDGV